MSEGKGSYFFGNKMNDKMHKVSAGKIKDTKIYTSSPFQTRVCLVTSHSMRDFTMLELVQSSHQGHSYII